MKLRGTLTTAIVMAAAVVAAGCGNSPTEPGESGTQYQLTDTARESRSGVDLILRYDQPNEMFTGTLANTTGAPVADVRVEIHLSNGTELGPTPRIVIGPGETNPVELDARGQSFTSFSVHIEIGPGS
ncbi:hypothetical protein [Candidatus Palauibacter sp.]|uniref:hypothetical protein n=1 Tax=Candidatus Palauibacter sp. TaxID=3101350 RepID=UPI003B521575